MKSKHTIVLFLLFPVILASCERKPSIHEVIRVGDVEKVKKILAKDPKSVNSREPGEFAQTPLCIAISEGNMEIVQILIEAGADVNMESYGISPLSEAAWRGDVAITEMLLSKGAFVEDESIIRAAEGGSEEVVRSLLDKGADVNGMRKLGRGMSRDSILSTPLKAAAKYGHTDIISLLLEHGAEINAKFENDWSALHLAVEGNSMKAVEILIEKGAEINARGYQGKTPLHVAAKGRLLYDPVKKAEYFRPVDFKILELLTERGAQINAEDDEGHTPLSYANKNHHTQISEFLRNHGAR